MTTYAIGDEKYDRSSLLAIAMTLLIGRLRSGGRRRWKFFGRHRQEHLFEAHSHGPELEQPPAAGDHRAREIAADVVPAAALDFIADDAVAPIRFGDARHARNARQRPRGIAARGVDLHIH